MRLDQLQTKFNFLFFFFKIEVSAAVRTDEAPGAQGEEAALATGGDTEGDATLLHGHHQSHPGHSRSPCQN